MNNMFLIFGTIGMTEIIFIALVVLLFFGGRKIPELMKGIGKGIKSFKDGVKGVKDDLDLDEQVKEINEGLDKDTDTNSKRKNK
jgi:sec-independent protein translocase protein TatA